MPKLARLSTSAQVPITNLLIRFTNDTIDQSTALYQLLQQRFPEMVTLQTLPGSHTTPLGQDVSWQTGTNFTPFDAMGQWFKQEIYRDLNQLKRTIVLWLNPFSHVSNLSHR